MVHYKSKTNKHLQMHQAVHHRQMVAEAVALVRRAAEAIEAEVEEATYKHSKNARDDETSNFRLLNAK